MITSTERALLPLSRQAREFAESTSTARGVLFGLLLSALPWAVILYFVLRG